MIVGTALTVAILGLLIWKITDRLLVRAQMIAKAREELHVQLLHASKLASVGELVAGIAHEINNPLAIISATSGVIQDLFDPEFNIEWTPETVRNELSIIDSAVLRARGITHKLLDFSRKNPPTLVPGNVNRILDNVVEGLKEQEFQIADIELVRHYSMDMPDILMDPDQMSQVFLNLVNNAGDAVDRGGTITLTTRHDDEYVRVSVTDTGQGMTSEQMEKIFTPFYTSKEVGKGTGLGLSVSLSIVESMGGKIEVQSIPGTGSSFTIILPIKEEPGDKGEETAGAIETQGNGRRE
jgi:two-component system NtrC family sensor kinase